MMSNIRRRISRIKTILWVTAQGGGAAFAEAILEPELLDKIDTLILNMYRNAFPKTTEWATQRRRERVCDCGFDGMGYMLDHDLWARVAREDEILCVACFEKRLGRRVTIADFLDAPINNTLRHMYDLPPVPYRTEDEA